MFDFQQITLSVLAVIIILDKFGILNKLPFMKNGNGKGVKEKLDLLETNHLHTINETLQRIERKLEEMGENILIIKTKQNGK